MSSEYNHNIGIFDFMDATKPYVEMTMDKENAIENFAKILTSVSRKPDFFFKM